MAFQLEQQRSAPTAGSRTAVHPNDCARFLHGLRVALAIALPAWVLLVAGMLAVIR